MVPFATSPEATTSGWIAPEAGRPITGAHVWRVTLDGCSGVARETTALLSDEERRRAQSFRFERDRRRFSVTRAALRILVACYLGDDPMQIQISAGIGEKPRVCGRPTGSAFFFNVAHSHEVALLCFSTIAEVGIDVEQLRDIDEAKSIAERFFSTREAAFVNGGDYAFRSERFLRCWTRKEAFLKGLGTGLSLPMERFTVPCEQHYGEVMSEGLLLGERWFVRGFSLEGGYLAALATPGNLPWTVPSLAVELKPELQSHSRLLARCEVLRPPGACSRPGEVAG